MMPLRRLTALLLTLLCLTAGLLLPALCVRLLDVRQAQVYRPFSDSSAPYAYQGTLMNRVLALNAHLNSSPLLYRENSAPSALPSGLTDRLSFLPLPPGQPDSIETFLLIPRQYVAEYRFTEISTRQDETEWRILLDDETGLPLRIEMTAPPEMVMSYLDDHGLWESLSGYAACLNLGELTDGPTNISTMIRSQSGQIRGTQLSVTFTAMPTAGTLLFKLTGSVSY